MPDAGAKKGGRTFASEEGGGGGGEKNAADAGESIPLGPELEPMGAAGGGDGGHGPAGSEEISAGPHEPLKGDGVLEPVAGADIGEVDEHDRRIGLGAARERVARMKVAVNPLAGRARVPERDQGTEVARDLLEQLGPDLVVVQAGMKVVGADGVDGGIEERVPIFGDRISIDGEAGGGQREAGVSLREPSDVVGAQRANQRTVREPLKGDPGEVESAERFAAGNELRNNGKRPMAHVLGKIRLKRIVAGLVEPTKPADFRVVDRQFHHQLAGGRPSPPRCCAAALPFGAEEEELLDAFASGRLDGRFERRPQHGCE